MKVFNETHHEIYCQGSLITESLILSAAHCFHYKDVIPKLHVVLGSDEPLKLNLKEGKKRNIEYNHEIGEWIHLMSIHSDNFSLTLSYAWDTPTHSMPSDGQHPLKKLSFMSGLIFLAQQ